MTGSRHAGPVTDAAFGVARGVTYLATALVVGLLAFLRFVWLPALDATAGAGARWAEASGAFAGRGRRLLFASIEAGVLAGGGGPPPPGGGAPRAPLFCGPPRSRAPAPPQGHIRRA